MKSDGDKIYRIIISGGGTGGHIFPAIAIADGLVQKYLKVKILFIGATGRMEMKKVPSAGYDIIGLNIAGLQRRLTLKNLLLPFKVISSLLQARKIIKKFKPHLAIGVGGYASGPMLFCASLSSVPTLIQEQNSYAGLTNKILAKFVDKICVAYSNMDKFFPKFKLYETGNPVRSKIINGIYNSKEGLEKTYLDMNLVPNKFTVFAFGGSLGSVVINNRMLESLDICQENYIQIILQTGNAHFYKVNNEVQKSKYKNIIKVLPFVDNMNIMYKMADIIICRSGALSISELCIVGKTVIFIPSPHLAEDHQTYNAKALADKNAAFLVKESDSIDCLHEKILEIKKNEEIRKQYSENIKKLAKPNATQSIIAEAEELLVKKK